VSFFAFLFPFAVVAAAAAVVSLITEMPSLTHPKTE
jgi:hypothetical protein